MLAFKINRNNNGVGKTEKLFEVASAGNGQEKNGGRGSLRR